MKKIVTKLWVDCFDHDCNKYTHCFYVDWENRAFFVSDKEEQERLTPLDNFLIENAEELFLVTKEREDNEE